MILNRKRKWLIARLESTAFLRPTEEQSDSNDKGVELHPASFVRPAAPFHVKPSSFTLAERCPAPDANRTLPLVVT